VKNSHVVVAVILIAALGVLSFPHLRSLYAKVKTATGGRKRVITGTADKGNDSGGVLTSAEVS
jgi:hypothetical protein